MLTCRQVTLSLTDTAAATPAACPVVVQQTICRVAA